MATGFSPPDIPLLVFTDLDDSLQLSGRKHAGNGNLRMKAPVRCTSAP